MKIIKRISAVTLSAIIVVLATVSAAAATYIIADGYRVELLSSTECSIATYLESDTSIALPEKFGKRTVTEIAARAFSGNSFIETVDLSQAKSLTKIGNSAFENSAVLKNVTLSESIKTFGRSAFRNCQELTEINLNTQATNVSAEMFYNCTKLSKVELSDNINSIGAYAFANCPELKSVTLGKNITLIDTTAFENDSDLVINCYRDSYALAFAKANNIKYNLIDGTLIGDVNQDGTISVLDATLVQKYVQGGADLTDYQKVIADINHDGEVSVLDAVIIQKIVAGASPMPTEKV